MPASDRGGLKAAFTNFNKPDADKGAELKLLGRTIDEERPTPPTPDSYQVATPKNEAPAGGLTPRPLLKREAVRQLSFRCPVSTATEL